MQNRDWRSAEERHRARQKGGPRLQNPRRRAARSRIPQPTTARKRELEQGQPIEFGDGEMATGTSNLSTLVERDGRGVPPAGKARPCRQGSAVGGREPGLSTELHGSNRADKRPRKPAKGGDGVTRFPSRERGALEEQDARASSLVSRAPGYVFRSQEPT